MGGRKKAGSGTVSRELEGPGHCLLTGNSGQAPSVWLGPGVQHTRVGMDQVGSPTTSGSREQQ